tara:strand:+ start:9605 stop:10075 length:471 start_codon:yes stop_codon:yes gene_type:complete
MINLKSLLNETFLGGGELPSSKLIKMKQTMAETMADDNDESVNEGKKVFKEIEKAIKGMKGVSMDIKGDTIIVSNKSGDEFIYSMNDADDVADFITTIEESVNEGTGDVDRMQEISADFSMFIKKNLPKIKRLPTDKQKMFGKLLGDFKNGLDDLI